MGNGPPGGFPRANSESVARREAVQLRAERDQSRRDYQELMELHQLACEQAERLERENADLRETLHKARSTVRAIQESAASDRTRSELITLVIELT